EFGDDEAEAVGAAYIINRHDMRLIQAGQYASLCEVGLDIFRLTNPMAVGHLDRHLPPQFLVVAFVDNAKTAGAESPRNTVAAQTLRVIHFSFLWVGRRVGRVVGRRADARSFS